MLAVSGWSISELVRRSPPSFDRDHPHLAQDRFGGYNAAPQLSHRSASEGLSGAVRACETGRPPVRRGRGCAGAFADFLSFGDPAWAGREAAESCLRQCGQASYVSAS
ncbi:MAG: hypothetical protein LBK41_07990 [Clostridiales bacterium]|nr:hypothetical protein [Clostridiales bacterium]